MMSAELQLAYNDPNKSIAEIASFRKLPAYGRNMQFWVKNQIIMPHNRTFSEMMTIVFRFLCFIEVNCE